MLVSKLIPQVEPHVKIGSAKVSRKETRKDYTFSLKLAKSQRRSFEQAPNITPMCILAQSAWELYLVKVGTIFVNSISNLLATAGMHAKLEVSSRLKRVVMLNVCVSLGFCTLIPAIQINGVSRACGSSFGLGTRRAMSQEELPFTCLNL